MATHFRILPWKTSWTEGPGGLQSMVSQKCQTRLSNSIITKRRHIKKLGRALTAMP